MLQPIKETVELSANVEKDGELIVVYSARIDQDGVSNGALPSIRNRELFVKYRQEVRQAQREFEKRLHEVEDRIMAGD